MAEARLEDSWERMAWIVAKLHNVNCTKRADLREPGSFNPYRRKRRRRTRERQNLGTIPLSQVADIFINRLNPKNRGQG